MLPPPDVGTLPPVLTTAAAADLLGIARGTLWAAARDGDAPVTPIRVGRALRWPTRPLLALLGLSGDDVSSTSQGAAVGDDPSNDELPGRNPGAVVKEDRHRVDQAYGDGTG